MSIDACILGMYTVCYVLRQVVVLGHLQEWQRHGGRAQPQARANNVTLQ